MNLLNKLTIKNLKLNKRRTIVTIIGIILSVALINSVATMYYSGMDSIIKLEKQTSGDYHTAFYNVPIKDIETIKNNRKVEAITKLKKLGNAEIESKSEDVPYLSVIAIEKNKFKNLGLQTINGRLPENENEIVIKKHFNRIFKKDYKIGDKIDLEIGERVSKDNNKLSKDEVVQPGEKIINSEKRNYTIVGIINDISSAIDDPGVIADTVVTGLSEKDNKDKIDLFIRLNKDGLKAPYNTIGDMLGIDGNLYKQVIENYSLPKSIEETEKLEKSFKVEKQKAKYGFYSKRFLIGMETDQQNTSFFGLKYIAGIAIAIIIFTSVFCIKNSFDISITEKSKQYGMLRSIGATKKQIRKNVLFEATILGLIGIPLGILLGYFASFILVKISNVLLQSSFISEGFGLIYSIKLMPAMISAILGIVTIYLSSLRIARKAAKVSPINSIRNSAEIKIKAKKLKTPKIIRKIFKIGGDISYKNMKRNKKRYRVTIISIVTSIIVYISLTAFMTVIMNQTEKAIGKVDFDVQLSVTEEKGDEIDKINKISESEEVERTTILKYQIMTLDKSIYNNEVKDYSDKFFENDEGNITVISVGKEEYNRYIKELGIDYNNIKDKAILYDKISTKKLNPSKTPVKEIRILKIKENEDLQAKMFGGKEDSKELKFKIGKIASKKPFAIENMLPINEKVLILSDEYFNKTFDTKDRIIQSYFKTKNDLKTQKTLEETFHEYKHYYVGNAKETYKQAKNLITLIGIFLYGFIIIIILIGVTNIVNTITTSMELRKPEFAILRSIGMTNKEFKRMIRLETIFIGIKSLLFGLPIGTGIAYLIYRVAKEPFEIPLKPIIYTTVVVVLLIAIIMRYSLNKIKKQNTIETIRNENI